MIDLFSHISSTGQLIIRLIAAVGGFVVGYLISGPFWRLFWRGAFRKPIPPGLVPWMKFCTGLVFAALLYALVHLSGGGGWGWGGGGGSGVGGGTGNGKGSGKGDTTGPGGDSTKKGTPDGPAAKTPGREILVVELLGGNRYPGDGKYYLLDRKEPPVAIAAIDETFKKRGDKIELHIHYSAESVGRHHGAADRLRDLARNHKIPLVEPGEGEK